MKTRITVAMIMFIGFVLCSAAVAYYPVLMVRCPHCKAHVVQEETVSGNTIGAKHFTDEQNLCTYASRSSLAGKVSSVRWIVLDR